MRWVPGACTWYPSEAAQWAANHHRRPQALPGEQRKDERKMAKFSDKLARSYTDTAIKTLAGIMIGIDRAGPCAHSVRASL